MISNDEIKKSGKVGILPRLYPMFLANFLEISRQKWGYIEAKSQFM